MKAVVLISAGRHPVSGRSAPAGTELQAIALARALGADPVGLHAGPDVDAVRPALGHGLPRLDHRRITPEDDPLPSLVAALEESRPDLVLAGARGGDGAQTGLLPYRLADALGWPIIADAVEIRWNAEAVEVVQARPKGARRLYRVRPPLLVTVYPAAPPAAAFAQGGARRGDVSQRAGIAAPDVEATPDERPYRPKPKLIGPATAGGGGRVMVNPLPDEAARAVLEHLRALGVIRR